MKPSPPLFQPFSVRAGFAFLALLLAAMLLLPIGGDVLLSFGSAVQADLQGSFPSNVYHSWNQRGIGYKYFIYGLYKFLSLLCAPDAHLQFQIYLRLIFYALFLPLSYCSFRAMRGFLGKLNIDPQLIFYLFLFSMLSIGAFCSLQPEEMSVYITLFLVAILIAGSRWAQYLSGLLVCLLLSLKIVTLGMAGFPALLLWFFYREYKAAFWRYVASSAFFLSAYLVSAALFFPLEIQDTLNAASFQDSLRVNAQLVQSFVTGSLVAWPYVPVLLPTLIYFIAYLWRRRQQKRVLLFGCLLLGLPVLMVLAQGKFTPYHYMAFVPFSMLAMAAITRKCSWKRPLGIILAASAAIWLVFSFGLWSIKPLKESAQAYYFANGKAEDHSKLKKFAYPVLFSNHLFFRELRQDRQSFIQQADSQFKLSQQPEIMFLCDGYINYLIRTRSYLRYYFPLPLQRVPVAASVKNSPVYDTVLQQAMAYKGDYIIVQSEWFKLKSLPELSKKIAAEYRLAGTFGQSFYYIEVYERRKP